MVKGTITRQGIYEDGKNICEIYILNADKNILPHEYGVKKLIDLIIGKTAYQAGVHKTKDGVVWISSILYEKGGKRKFRLVDALEANGVNFRDPVILKIVSSGCYKLELDCIRKC